MDVPAGTPYHEPTLEALDHAAGALGASLSVNVVKTESITPSYFEEMPDGVVIGPGTPYNAPLAAEDVIGAARQRGIPLVAI